MNGKTNGRARRHQDIDFYAFSGLNDLPIDAIKHIEWFTAFPVLGPELRSFLKKILLYYTWRKQIEGGYNHLQDLPEVPDIDADPKSSASEESPASPDSVIVIDEEEGPEVTAVEDEGDYDIIFPSYSDHGGAGETPTISPQSPDPNNYPLDSEMDGEVIVSGPASPAAETPASPEPYSEPPATPRPPSVSLFIDDIDGYPIPSDPEATHSGQDEFLESIIACDSAIAAGEAKVFVVDGDDEHPLNEEEASQTTTSGGTEDDEVEITGEVPPPKKRRRRQQRSTIRANSQSSSSSSVSSSDAPSAAELQMQQRMQLLQQANRAVQHEREFPNLIQQTILNPFSCPPLSVPSALPQQPYATSQQSCGAPFFVPPSQHQPATRQLTPLPQMNFLKLLAPTNPFGPDRERWME